MRDCLDVDTEGLLTFPARLVFARTRAKLTQHELALKAQLRPENISRWERGEREPSWEGVQRLAQALEVSLDWLAFGRESRVDADDVLPMNHPAVIAWTKTREGSTATVEEVSRVRRLFGRNGNPDGVIVHFALDMLV